VSADLVLPGAQPRYFSLAPSPATEWGLRPWLEREAEGTLASLRHRPADPERGRIVTAVAWTVIAHAYAARSARDSGSSATAVSSAERLVVVTAIVTASPARRRREPQGGLRHARLGERP
jgi:hypothetical protein